MKQVMNFKKSPRKKDSKKYYGVTYSTDMRDRRTAIYEFKDEQEASTFLNVAPTFTHDDPDLASNYHHTLREVYILGREIYLEDINKNSKHHEESTRDYPRTIFDSALNFLRDMGEELF